MECLQIYSFCFAKLGYKELLLLFYSFLAGVSVLEPSEPVEGGAEQGAGQQGGDQPVGRGQQDRHPSHSSSPVERMEPPATGPVCPAQRSDRTPHKPVRLGGLQ